MKCLMVIDMQYNWKASRKKWLIQNIKKRVKQARKDGIFILFVEQHGNKKSIDDTFGRTSKTIMKEVIGYHNHSVVVKTDSDGSDEIYSFFKENNIWPTKFEVCGVQTSICVFKTVLGLSCLMYSAFFKMIKNCLNDVPFRKEEEKETMEQFYQKSQFAVI